MKISKVINIIILGLLGSLTLCLLIPQPVFCQTEKLGIVKYTTPIGMTKSSKGNLVAFSELNEATGKFCIITLYGATSGTGNPQGDFAREWANSVVRNMKAAETPSPDASSSDGWTLLAGGSAVDSDAGKAVAFLTVISGFGKSVSILAVFNDPSYVKKIDTFVSAIDIDKAGSADATVPVLDRDQYGNIIIPPLTRQLNLSDLAGEWGENPARESTTYVYRDSGNYAGSDSIAYTSKYTFTSTGTYATNFFGIRNGQKIVDKTTGSIRVEGSVLYLKHKGTTKYVLRGWLDLPDRTILLVTGAWYDDQEIPANIFTNPEQGTNLNKKWVRMK